MAVSDTPCRNVSLKSKKQPAPRFSKVQAAFLQRSGNIGMCPIQKCRLLLNIPKAACTFYSSESSISGALFSASITHPSQLHAHRWLHFLPVRTTLQHGGESYFLDIADSIACTHLAAVCSLTESGFGLSLQVGGEVREKIAQGRLKTVLPEWTLPPVSLYLVTPYRVQSAKTEAAVRIFTESFAKEADA